MSSSTSRLSRPAVDGQAERGLGDEGVAADRLERRAGGVGVGLVVAGDDPDLASMLEAHLGGAEDVAGRVKRDADAIDIDGIAVGQASDAGARFQTVGKNPESRRGGEVGPAAPGDVVAVGVGDDGAIHRGPGIDVEVARLAVEPAIGQPEQGHSMWVGASVALDDPAEEPRA